jgi:hypothetical protein
MKYQKSTYLPTEEFINELKELRPYPHTGKDSMENNHISYIYEILKICMNQQDSKTIYNDVVYIKIWLDNIKQCAIQNCINDNIYQYEHNHEINFIGFDKIIDIENEYQIILEYLLDSATIIYTPDFYKEPDNFNHKLNSIKDIIHNYYNNVYNWYNIELINKLEPYKKQELSNNTDQEMLNNA